MHTLWAVAVLLLLHIVYSVDINAFDSRIFYTGRVSKKDPTKTFVQFDWSGVSYSLSFTNVTRLPFIKQQDTVNLYAINVETDKGQVTSHVLETNKQDQKYDLSYGVKLNPDTTYKLTVYKRTEASFGIVKFYGFEFHDGDVPVIKVPTSKNALKFQFFGDSFTCAYGNEGNPPCKFSAQTENVQESWVSIYSRALQADYQISCWSGKGVVRNYGDKNTTSERPLPFYLNFTLANDPASTWDFSQFQPDIVFIALGGNDFSTEPRPSVEEYAKGYNTLLDRVIKYYPGAKIFCLCISKNSCYDNRTKRIVEARADKSITFIPLNHVLWLPGDWGCDGHPSVLGDHKLAKALLQLNIHK